MSPGSPSVSVSTLFGGLPLLERFAAAAPHGFSAVELWWPPVGEHDAICAAVERAGVTVSLLTIERGVLADPGAEGRWQTAIEHAFELAARLACTRLYTLIGGLRQEVPPARARDTVTERLEWVADQAAGRGLGLLIEPVNASDNGPQLIEGVDDAAALLRDLGRDNAALLFDVYHARHAEGDVAQALERVRDQVGHIHLSDYPGRVEPGRGELDFRAIGSALDVPRYRGTIGLEWISSGPPTGASLSALERAGLLTLATAGL